MSLPRFAFLFVFLAWTALAQRPLKVDSSGKPGFTLLSPAITGITFTNRLAQERHFTLGAILNKNRAGTSMALADIDGDGDLDLYVANYRRVTLRDQPNTHFTVKTIAGQPQVTAIDGKPLTDPDLTNRFTFRVSMG